jgi:hypothetical protein
MSTPIYVTVFTTLPVGTDIEEFNYNLKVIFSNFLSSSISGNQIVLSFEGTVDTAAVSNYVGGYSQRPLVSYISINNSIKESSNLDWTTLVAWTEQRIVSSFQISSVINFNTSSGSGSYDCRVVDVSRNKIIVSANLNNTIMTDTILTPSFILNLVSDLELQLKTNQADSIVKLNAVRVSQS